MSELFIFYLSLIFQRNIFEIYVFYNQIVFVGNLFSHAWSYIWLILKFQHFWRDICTKGESNLVKKFRKNSSTYPLAGLNYRNYLKNKLSLIELELEPFFKKQFYNGALEKKSGAIKHRRRWSDIITVRSFDIFLG